MTVENISIERIDGFCPSCNCSNKLQKIEKRRDKIIFAFKCPACNGYVHTALNIPKNKNKCSVYLLDITGQNSQNHWLIINSQKYYYIVSEKATTPCLKKLPKKLQRIVLAKIEALYTI